MCNMSTLMVQLYVQQSAKTESFYCLDLLLRWTTNKIQSDEAVWCRDVNRASFVLTNPLSEDEGLGLDKGEKSKAKKCPYATWFH